MGNYLALPLLTHAAIAAPHHHHPPHDLTLLAPPPSHPSSSSYFSLPSSYPHHSFSSLYSLGPQLGTASPNSVVRLCTCLSTGVPYACKTFSKHTLGTDAQLQSVRREILIARKLSAANAPSGAGIVQLHNVVEDADNIHLVMELCHGGSVYERMLKRAKAAVERGQPPGRPVFSEAEAATIMKGLLESLEACHSEGIIHRDVKLRNILLVGESEEDFRVKLADFGMSTILTEKGGSSPSSGHAAGSYPAPEEILQEYGEGEDLWSAGVVLHILLSGKLQPSFMVRRRLGITEKEIEHDARLSMADPVWSRISVRGKDMVRGLLRKNPTKRLTASEALEHPWIRQHSPRRTSTMSSMYTTCDAWLPIP